MIAIYVKLLASSFFNTRRSRLYKVKFCSGLVGGSFGFSFWVKLFHWGFTIFCGGLHFFVKASLKIVWAFIKLALHHAFPSPHALPCTWSADRKFLMYLEGALGAKFLPSMCEMFWKAKCLLELPFCFSLFFHWCHGEKKFIIFSCCFISSNAQGARHSQKKWPPKMAHIVAYYKTAHSSSVTLHMLHRMRT
jgi:hypothetical protein